MIEITPVNNSAMIKVIQTNDVTFSEKVNAYAIGKTKIHNLHKDKINGLIAFPNP